MKRHTKKILGAFGLVAVVGITAFAAFLPAPETNAATSSSFTDNVSVRVVGSAVNVDISGITSGEVIITPTQTFTVSYENVETVTVEMDHTSFDGTTTHYILDTIDADYAPGTRNYIVNFNSQSGE